MIPAAILAVLLRHLLHHLPGSTEARPRSRAGCFREEPAGGALHHLIRYSDVAALTVVRPANEDRAGLRLFIGVFTLLADGRKAFPVRLAGLLFEELIDRLLL